jgi:quercetin dioxygenase-like cupin family protein
MNKLIVVGIAAAALLTVGCSENAAAAPEAAQMPSQVVELPTEAGPGAPKEVKVLFKSPGLKLATITLRNGTVLGGHAAPVPVTIYAISGKGTVTAGDERFELDPAHAVVLGAGVHHAVEPAAGTDMVLLVHHLGGADGGHHK